MANVPRNISTGPGSNNEIWLTSLSRLAKLIAAEAPKPAPQRASRS